MQKILLVAMDVTDLSDREAETLAFEMGVQGEHSEEHGFANPVEHAILEFADDENFDLAGIVAVGRGQ